MTRCSVCNLMSDDVRGLLTLCRDCENKKNRVHTTELERRIEELTGLKFSDRNYEAMKSRTEVAERERDIALSKVCAEENTSTIRDLNNTVTSYRAKITKLEVELEETKAHLEFFLSAECPSCGYNGKLLWMESREGYVSEPGEYWCSACNSVLRVAYLQQVNRKLSKKMERLERERTALLEYNQKCRDTVALYKAELRKLEQERDKFSDLPRLSP